MNDNDDRQLSVQINNKSLNTVEIILLVMGAFIPWLVGIYELASWILN